MKTRDEILNEMIKEHTPMQVINPATVPNDNESSVAAEAHVNRMIRRCTGPMVVVAGPVSGTRNGRPVAVAGEDQNLLERTKHVRFKKETMNEFFARVGLAASQIRTMSKDEISRFAEVATANAEDFGSVFKFKQAEVPKRDLLGRVLDRILVGKRPAFEPEPRPATILIDTGA